MPAVTMDPDHLFAVATAPRRNSRHWTNTAFTWGEIRGWMENPGSVKESGNYLMGTLRPTTVQHNPDDGPCLNKLHRRKEAVVTRSALTLDLDTPNDNLPDLLDLLIDHAAILHTTYSSTSTSPHYRLIIPLDREVKPDEYVAAAQAVMKLVGEENFDPSTTEHERYMFRPAALDPALFHWWEYEGDPASVESLLEDWEPDLSKAAMPAPPRKRDPFEIEGVVGAFNKAYQDWQLLIQEYDLPYVPAESGDRWHLVGAASVAGMGEVAPGIVYSHHSSDPAFGQACTAFDLVRLHMFGDLDDGVKAQTPINRLPSYLAMQDLARIDARAVAQMVGEDFEQVAEETSWKLQLGIHLDRGGKLKDRVEAWDIVMANDPIFKSISYNQMTLSIETNMDLPWRDLEPGGPVFRNSDRSSLQMYLEREYRCRPARSVVDWMVEEVARKNIVNPVRDWLDELEWDGTPRLEECLPGVKPTPYTRMVARKSMVAAVARMFEPGCKWDHTLILFGPEGLGKTYWIEKMALDWTSPLGPVGHKDTLIVMQRSWIVVSDEGVSMKKSDSEALKQFLTQRSDVFRLPYEREASNHPRHSVIWGSTNDNVFLRQQEGNRRFLIVKCEEKVDFEQLTDYYISQVWAEAMHLYRQGEVLLWLDEREDAMAAVERSAFTEEGNGPMEGLIRAYLDLGFPKDWEFRGVESRQQWLQDQADGLLKEGPLHLDYVCTLQLYNEALGRKHGTHNRLDLLEIGKVLRQIGWSPGRERMRCGPYGAQAVFHRPVDDVLRDIL